jgi:hypothetical protein
MKLGSYTQNEDDIHAQETGSRVVWPEGITSWNPTGVEVLVKDATPPGPVDGVHKATSPYSSLRVAWSPAVDAESGILSYRVKRDSTVLGVVPHPYLTDLFPLEDSATYTVTAINRVGLESEPVTVTLHPDSEALALTRNKSSLGPSSFGVSEAILNTSRGVLSLLIDIPAVQGKRETSISVVLWNAHGRSLVRLSRLLTAGQRHRVTLNAWDAGVTLAKGVYFLEIIGPQGARWTGRVVPLAGLNVIK